MPVAGDGFGLHAKVVLRVAECVGRGHLSASMMQSAVQAESLRGVSDGTLMAAEKYVEPGNRVQRSCLAGWVPDVLVEAEGTLRVFERLASMAMLGETSQVEVRGC